MSANPIGPEFMRLTQSRNLSPSAQSQGAPQPALELPVPPEARRIPLPAPGEIRVPAIDLRAAIEQRRSVRKYTEQPLSLGELAFLLWCTQGVKKVTSRPVTLRTVPSAGAQHAFETFVLANRVTGLAPGLYRYAALEHALLEADLAPDVAERAVQACQDQHMVGQAAASFFWVAVVERMRWRYCERSYRYLHLDAGHVCQNLYLAAEAIGCGMCAIAAYDDDLLNRLVGADGEELFAIYAASLGKKSS
jgi:SagB-type dehydrogenase family enzyme